MLNELKDRISSDTPDYWKKVRNISMGAAVIGGLIIGLPALGITIPAWIIGIGAYMAKTGPLVAGLAQTAKK